MLKGQLLHPGILHALGRCGHGSKILIADGNFPFLTKTRRSAELVSLNLSPGIVNAVDTLKALCSCVPIESGLVMAPPVIGEFAMKRPAIWNDFENVIQEENPAVILEQVGRFNFYDCCLSSDVGLIVATAEQRIFANILLTIGVVQDHTN